MFMNIKLFTTFLHDGKFVDNIPKIQPS